MAGAEIGMRLERHAGGLRAARKRAGDGRRRMQERRRIDHPAAQEGQERAGNRDRGRPSPELDRAALGLQPPIPAQLGGREHLAEFRVLMFQIERVRHSVGVDSGGYSLVIVVMERNNVCTHLAFKLAGWLLVF